MKIYLFGTRGSTPTPGRDFVRYGGHTSCVGIGPDVGPPTLMIDAGTGIRAADAVFSGEPFRGSILFGHLHWDHTQGLPFFSSADRNGARADVYLPAQGDGEAVFERFMSPPHFPITPRGLKGSWSFRALEPGEHELEGFSVLALDIPHGGGRTFGYRVSDGRSTLAYLSDHCPTDLGPGADGFGEYHDTALALTEGCDLVFHDSQYTAEELPTKAHYGHSAYPYAVGLAVAAKARELVLFHHDPSRTDDEVDAIVKELTDAPLPVRAATQGQLITLG
jgi:phosphoribosyl 1,2-cyclic phosphodiesterase